MVESEINSLKLLKHPNVARLLQLIENEHYIYVIREVCAIQFEIFSLFSLYIFFSIVVMVICITMYSLKVDA